MKKVPELFGSMVFNEAVMKERLPKDVYKSLKQTVRQGTALDPQVAGVVANAMKDWAIEKGATSLCSVLAFPPSFQSSSSKSAMNALTRGRIEPK